MNKADVSDHVGFFFGAPGTADSARGESSRATRVATPQFHLPFPDIDQDIFHFISTGSAQSIRMVTQTVNIVGINKSSGLQY